MTPNTTLAPCPTSPNCVSTQAPENDKQHFIEPFKLIVPIETAWEIIIDILGKQARTKITQQEPYRLHAEASSLVFRFVDDIDILLDLDTAILHIRSASRTGYSDLGVNRKRVEALRTQLQQANIIE